MIRAWARGQLMRFGGARSWTGFGGAHARIIEASSALFSRIRGAQPPNRHHFNDSRMGAWAADAVRRREELDRLWRRPRANRRSFVGFVFSHSGGPTPESPPLQ